ncbi:DUF6970 domain-containing protein [Catalinimonas alkaloidigena]|uniref:DUF6970 domain-containing protein n=1 Tax=Catalinimonas alkaloidigena TaxID=1075417 RepID=UPI001FE238C2|nr:hypothetical protein [Catalinimonas alkaloidigena]
MFLLLFGGCAAEKLERGTPACVQAKIQEILREDVWNPPAKVYRYTYRGQTVYFIPQRCCDIPSVLLDENCTPLCAPDGGFTGKGDGQCADFFETRTDEALIWEDPRP